MSPLLLDTTFLIDAERGSEALDDVIADDDDLAIAAVTVAELLVGVELPAARYRATRREYVEAVLSAIPVLDYDTRVAVEHAGLLAAVRKAGRPRGAHDLIIAATACATGRTLITANASAFVDLPGIDALPHR